jgi:ankyrin repeat protein
MAPLRCTVLALGSTGYVEIVKYFVEMCGENIYAVNSDGDTPLHISAGSWCGQLKVLKYFVEKCSANVNLVNTMGDTPLHCACKEGQIYAV